MFKKLDGIWINLNLIVAIYSSDYETEEDEDKFEITFDTATISNDDSTRFFGKSIFDTQIECQKYIDEMMLNITKENNV